MSSTEQYLADGAARMAELNAHIEPTVRIFRKVEVRYRVPAVERILRACSDAFGVSVADVRGRSHRAEAAQPRQLAMYVALEVLGWNLCRIGRQFGGYHHTTVLHSIRAVDARREADPDYSADVDRIVAQCRGSRA